MTTRQPFPPLQTNDFAAISSAAREGEVSVVSSADLFQRPPTKTLQQGRILPLSSS